MSRWLVTVESVSGERSAVAVRAESEERASGLVTAAIAFERRPGGELAGRVVSVEPLDDGRAAA